MNLPRPLLRIRTTRTPLRRVTIRPIGTLPLQASRWPCDARAHLHGVAGGEARHLPVRLVRLKGFLRTTKTQQQKPALGRSRAGRGGRDGEANHPQTKQTISPGLGDERQRRAFGSWRGTVSLLAHVTSRKRERLGYTGLTVKKQHESVVRGRANFILNLRARHLGSISVRSQLF